MGEACDKKETYLTDKSNLMHQIQSQNDKIVIIQSLQNECTALSTDTENLKLQAQKGSEKQGSQKELAARKKAIAGKMKKVEEMKEEEKKIQSSGQIDLDTQTAYINRNVADLKIEVQDARKDLEEFETKLKQIEDAKKKIMNQIQTARKNVQKMR